MSFASDIILHKSVGIITDSFKTKIKLNHSQKHGLFIGILFFNLISNHPGLICIKVCTGKKYRKAEYVQRRVRSSALRKSFHVNICISRLCIKMSSFLYMCTYAQCRVNFIHHVEFYFRFQHLITLPVYSQLWHSSQGE